MPTSPESFRPGVAVMPRTLAVLLGVAAAVVAIAGMRSAAWVVGPVFLALVVTITAHPMRAPLERHLPGWAATVVCLVVVYVLLVGFALALVVSAARFASLLPEYETQFNDRISQVTAHLHSFSVSDAQVANLNQHLDLGRLTGAVTAVLSSVLSSLSSLVLILAVLFFMAIDGSGFPRRLAAAASVRPTLISALVGFAHGTRRYILVSTVFGLIVAACDTIALAIMGVPAPVLWGLLAFLTNYIPNIGFFIGLVPPAVLAGLDSGVGLMVAVIVVYCVLNMIIQSGIQPKVVGDAVGLATTLTFLSVVFWSWVVGPLGAILAIPLSLFVRAVLVDADPGGRWLRTLVANSDQVPESRPLGPAAPDGTGQLGPHLVAPPPATPPP